MDPQTTALWLAPCFYKVLLGCSHACLFMYVFKWQWQNWVVGTETIAWNPRMFTKCQLLIESTALPSLFIWGGRVGWREIQVSVILKQQELGVYLLLIYNPGYSDGYKTLKKENHSTSVRQKYIVQAKHLAQSGHVEGVASLLSVEHSSLKREIELDITTNGQHVSSLRTHGRKAAAFQQFLEERCWHDSYSDG